MTSHLSSIVLHLQYDYSIVQALMHAKAGRQVNCAKQVLLEEQGGPGVPLTINGISDTGYLTANDERGESFELHPDGNRCVITCTSETAMRMLLSPVVYSIAHTEHFVVVIPLSMRAAWISLLVLYDTR